MQRKAMTLWELTQARKQLSDLLDLIDWMIAQGNGKEPLVFSYTGYVPKEMNDGREKDPANSGLSKSEV